MRQVTRMRIGKGLWYLNYEQVDHLNELARDRLLEQSKLGLPEMTVYVIVAITVLGHLHKDIIVLVDLVGGYNMRCLWRQVDPWVDDWVDLLAIWRRCAAILYDWVPVELLEDELLVCFAQALHRAALRFNHIALRRYDIHYLNKKSSSNINQIE